MNAMSKPPGHPDAAISEADYHRFCTYFYQQTGISFGGNKQYYVDKRLLERIEKTGAGNFAAYFATLKQPGSGPEIEKPSGPMCRMALEIGWRIGRRWMISISRSSARISIPRC